MHRTSRPLRLALRGAPILLALCLVGASAPAARADGPPASGRDRILALLSPEQTVDVHFCEHLGWQFVDDPAVTEIEVHTGRPCTRESLRDARRRGDLRVRIPPNASDALLLEFAQKLPLLSDSVGSRCAYQLRLSEAAERAVAKLSESLDAERWVFPEILFMDSPWWRLGPPEPEWMRIEKKAYRPRCSPRAAIESFFTKDAVTECYAGQLVVLFTIQYMLYGPERFDYAFAPTDVVIGRPPLVETVPFGWNVWEPGYHDRRAMFVEGEAQAHDPALTLAALGPKAFVGMAGILQDPRDQMQCNENFVLVSISDRAMREVVAAGGFKGIAKATAEMRRLHLEAKSLFSTAATIEQNRAAIDAILARPMFSELMIFIHPYGVIPLAEIAKSKLDRMDVGLKMSLYACGREYAFFRRYAQVFARLWFAQNLPTQPCMSVARSNAP